MANDSIQEIADYLTDGYWTGLGQLPRAWDVSDFGGTIRYTVTATAPDPNGLTAARAQLVRDAFSLYEAVLGIDFAETTDTSQSRIHFYDNDVNNANTTIQRNGTEISFVAINIGSAWNGGTSNPYDYTFQSILHEIGHGLGLGHPGPYNGPGGITPLWSNDSWQQSIMSYRDQVALGTGQTLSWLTSPMAADWLALDALYEPQGYGTSNAFTGDTVWGFGATGLVAKFWPVLQLAEGRAFCIVDGGGIDTLDLSGFSAAQRIDLTPASATSTTGTLMNAGGGIGNLSLGVGVQIEHAIGGSGSDTIIGNGAANTLTGGRGSDTIKGAAGSDVLIGGAGLDFLIGGAGGDVFRYEAFSQSTPARPDEVFAEGAHAAFLGAGSAAGDLFDFRSLGDLNWGGTDRGSIYLRNVDGATHCYVNADRDAAPELAIAIYDGEVVAGAYTAADFWFV